MKSKKTLSVEEIKEAVSILRQHRVKPVWRLTWKFPFIGRFYQLSPEMLSNMRAGRQIDYEVKILEK